MPTYESIRYKFSGAAVTNVLKPSNNLDDVSAAGTSRSNLGLAIGSNVQAFISATAGTNANGNRTVSSGNPTGGSDGDIWLKVS